MDGGIANIPERCKGCPLIFPVFNEYINREAELYMLENNPGLTEYADAADIHRRADELQTRLDQVRENLEKLRVLTVGCAGIKLAQIVLDGEYITNIECQSHLK